MAVLTPAKLTTLRRAFVDVCNGYSCAYYKNLPIFVRHLSHFEHLQYDVLQLRFEEEAKKKGAKTEEERLSALLKKGLWNKSKDKTIEEQKSYITGLEEGKKTATHPSLTREYEKQIDEEKGKLNKLLIEKSELIGRTTEVYAQHKLNDYYMVTNLFVDEELKALLFTPDQFDELDTPSVDEILSIYNSAIDPCTDVNLKFLSVQDFFTAYYGLCGDEIQTFFGRPICKMTYYQIRLGNIARYFKSIMEGCDLSRVEPGVRNDPDQLERLYTAQKNLKEMEANGNLPGANLSAQDIKELGLEGRFAKVTAEKSGNDLVAHLRGQK